MTRPSQKLYCSNSCQQEGERRVKTARWLETGEAAWMSGRRHFIRLYLMDEQQGRCAICERPAEWEGAHLAFVLDHVDGDATNNRRENLRLVCPNCDSQLPTFKSRNRGNGRAWRQQRYAEGKSY
jgi:hypothetical protein